MGVSRLRPHFHSAVGRAINALSAAGCIWVPDIMTDAPTAIGGAWPAVQSAGHSIERTALLPRPLCISQNLRRVLLIPISCGVMFCVNYVRNANHVDIEWPPTVMRASALKAKRW